MVELEERPAGPGAGSIWESLTDKSCFLAEGFVDLSSTGFFSGYE